MPDIPEEAVRAAAEAMQEEEDTRTWPSWERLARIALETAEPLRVQREEEVRADERRKTAEEIAAAILADADPLIATRTGPAQWEGAFRAARIARQIGEDRV